MKFRDLIQWNDGGQASLQVRVKPKASANWIRLNGPRVRVGVTVAPEDGKANKQVLKLLAKELGLPKSALSIARGHSSRDKVIVLQKS